MKEDIEAFMNGGQAHSSESELLRQKQYNETASNKKQLQLHI